MFIIHIIYVCARNKSLKHVCTNINRNARACARQVFCHLHLPVATALTEKLTVSADERSSHTRDTV